MKTIILHRRPTRRLGHWPYGFQQLSSPCLQSNPLADNALLNSGLQLTALRHAAGLGRAVPRHSAPTKAVQPAFYASTLAWLLITTTLIGLLLIGKHLSH